MDRPPADPAKLLLAWAEGETGEATPGRTLSTLKTGGFRDLIEHLASDQADGQVLEAAEASDVTALLAAWMEWETGQTPPPDVWRALAAAGLRPLLERLARAAAAPAPGSPEG